MAGGQCLGTMKLGLACLAISVLFCDVCCQPGEKVLPLGGKTVTFTREDYLQMESQLEYVKSVAVKTFQTEHGDLIDCVPFDKQPSLNHPALKGHVVQKAPSFVPEGLVTKTKQPSETQPEPQGCSAVEGVKSETIFARFPDEGCPEGTVPIMRPGNLESLRKQYANQGEGSTEQVQGKGGSSTTEARDDDDDHHASGYKTNDWSKLDGIGLVQASRKLSHGRMLSFKSMLY
ncbi:uncharacterized protein [Aristolochia californica]|uniref:uncharacterized protein isoform X2 n=1 Tax=Aristolochia californica TaxID=171875 RepID=UPI0035DF8B43